MSKNKITIEGYSFIMDGKEIGSYTIEQGIIDINPLNSYYARFRDEMQEAWKEKDSKEMMESRDNLDEVPEEKEEAPVEEAPVEVVKDEDIEKTLCPKDMEGCPEYDFYLCDKTPEVLEFARDNMTEKQFYKHYNKAFIKYETK